MPLFTFIRRSKGLAALLCVALVAACALPALWRMDCHTSGTSEVAWFNIDPCCHPDLPVQAPELKHHCCDYSHAEASLDPSQELTTKQWTAFHDLAALTHRTDQPGTLTAERTSTSPVEHPPPRYGGELLIAIGLFRI